MWSEVGVDDRESGVSGAGGQFDQVEDGVSAIEAFDGHARGHEVLSGAFTEAQGTVDESGGGFVEDAAFGGGAHEGAEFLWGPRGA